MADLPYFSIILPTYNRAGFLPATITSIQQQTFQNFELLIIDDGSKDATAEVIERFLEKDNRICYIYQNNAERGAARNFGLQKASGEYAVFFDSDDWMKPDYLQILHSAIAANNNPDFVAAKYSFQDEEGNEWPSSMAAVKEGWYGIETFLKGNMLACNFCVRLSNPNLQYFPPERELAAMEDWLFLLRNLQNSKIFIKEGVGVIMREHGGRSMANNRKIIVAREKATGWALQHLSLAQQQVKILRAFSAYFCGIHEYIEGNGGAALKYSVQAFKLGGMQPVFLVLFIKSLIGKKFIQRFQRHAG